MFSDEATCWADGLWQQVWVFRYHRACAGERARDGHLQGFVFLLFSVACCWECTSCVVLPIHPLLLFVQGVAVYQLEDVRLLQLPRRYDPIARAAAEAVVKYMVCCQGG